MNRARSIFGSVVAFTVALSAPLSAQTPPKFHHLHGGLIEGVFFLDQDHGWTAEDGGRIRVTADGGLSWSFANTDDIEDPDAWVQLNNIVVMDVGGGAVQAWAVGDNGVVLRSSDTAGLVWADANEGARVTSSVGDGNPCQLAGQLAKLWDIFMIDADNGWLVGNDGVVRKTADGGATWSTPISLPGEFGCAESPRDLYEIHFFQDSGDGYDDYDKGIIASDYGNVYVTEDGGGTWVEVDVVGGGECPPPPGGQHPNIELWSLAFDNPLVSTSPGWAGGGVLAGPGYIFRTTNGGVSESWQQSHDFNFLVPSGSPVPMQICGISTSYALAALGSTDPLAISAGYAGEIFACESSAYDFDPCDCEQVSPPIASDETWVQRSTVTDPVHPLGSKSPSYGAARISATEACIVGAFGRIQRFDSDATDEVIDVATPYFLRLSDGSFFNETTGCVIGDGWVIMFTDDGGVSWTVPDLSWTPNDSPDGNGIDLSPSGDYGVGVGTGGFIAHSDDVGASWTRVVGSPVSVDLNAVAFVPNSSTVFAVGSDGNVIKSTDNGETWASVTTTGSEDLFGVSFATTSVGYVVGEDAKAYRTTDGGTTWSNAPASGSSAESFRDVQTWGDGTEAIIVADNGGVYQRTASAQRFAKVDLSSLAVSEHLQDVEVLNSGSNVRICGDNGVVLFRDSGSWTRVRSQTTERLHRLSFQSATHGFGIGQGSVVVEYD